MMQSTSPLNSTTLEPTLPLAAKSAFTPIVQRPIAVRSPMSLFEPSPINKLLYYTILAQHHQEAQ
jgi:hypothetical protein